MLLSLTIVDPATSPITKPADIDGDGVPDDIDEFPSDPQEFKDSDGDGVGDRADMFPHDSSETDDQDMDGVGDNSDFFDEGNGGVKISITRFEFEGYASNYHRIKYCPDAWFQILVDCDGDDDYEHVFESEIFFCVERLENFFESNLFSELCIGVVQCMLSVSKRNTCSITIRCTKSCHIGLCFSSKT